MVTDNTSSKNNLAIVAFLLSLLFIFIQTLAPFSLIAGIVAYQKSQKEHNSGKILAIAAIIISGIVFLLSLIHLGGSFATLLSTTRQWFNR